MFGRQLQIQFEKVFHENKGCAFFIAAGLKHEFELFGLKSLFVSLAYTRATIMREGPVAMREILFKKNKTHTKITTLWIIYE